MTEPRWLTLEEILVAHERQLARFGGPAGLRDLGALESALDRPRNKLVYGETELASLAAAYAYGIARNHPFVDGNKRAAFIAMMVFLRLNGVRFAPSPAEATSAILGLAAGEILEEGLTRWIRANLPPATE
ncbi:type II toxin-antitoxin system death-on-curing family toxin [Kaistia terrae]|uniref:Type II toxin-antitoxin system death-on-curing family toxin n=1 Tax=Kaistia terrae TaxID=537017 RepID=A0ABW0PP90_9HYPH|nr:type II toxin-antitoxin system death-on-curing family toxin [Kaistia terrae]MCX5580128.1 type II toxin-antitoxin system death-on-curing family toxin [Kaistia terrae]